MKKLYLVRHAKSSWDNPELHDFDRPLNKRGERDAPEMGSRLAQQGISPQLLLSSPATRAYTTAIIIGSKIGYSQKNIKTDEALYHADIDDLLTIVKQQNNQNDSIMLFGHNPGFTDFANYISIQDIDNIPTCGIFAIAFETEDWKQIEGAPTRFLFFDYPKKPNKEKFLS